VGCRAMYVVASESLRASMAVTSSRTPTRLAEAKIRNGSILYGSTHLTYGAPTQIQTFAYRWTHGSHIWSRPSKLPKAYWCIPADPSVAAKDDRFWHKADVCDCLLTRLLSELERTSFAQREFFRF